MSYTRIDIVGGEECHVEFESLREAARERPTSGASWIGDERGGAVAFAKTDVLEWVPSGEAYGDEAEVLVLAPVARLRARLAEALELTSPTDDELVKRAEEAMRGNDHHRTLAAQNEASFLAMTELAGEAVYAPALTGAPLPEGREGESIVVTQGTKSAIFHWVDTQEWSVVWGGWPIASAEPGATGYRWAYIRRID